MRESLVPPFTHSNAFGSRIASAHWEQSSAKVLETFIRLTGASVSEGRLWSRGALDADALSVELTLRLAGDGAALVGADAASGVALWFAAASTHTPRLAEAFASPVLGDAATKDELSAIGVVFTAEGAQIVVQTTAGVVGIIGTCRTTLRFDAAKRSYNALSSPRVARLELATGAHNETALAGYVRLTLIKNPKVGRRKAAVLCDERVFVDALRDRAWLRSARVGLEATAPLSVDPETPSPPRADRRHQDLGFLNCIGL